MRWLLFTLAACRVTTSTSDVPDARESPQASAQPAALATLPTAASAASPSVEGGPPPAPLRPDEALIADTLPRDSPGYTLSAAFRNVEVLGPVRGPEVNPVGLDAARRATEQRLAIDISPARMRVALGGHGFVLAPDTEVRARSDRYGHIVVWPGATAYRPLAPGSLRALLGERRLDVAPLSAAEMAPHDDGGRRIGIRMRKVDVTTRAARVAFEIGRLEGAGEGGVLLCRFLLDLVSAPPSTALCGPDELPVRAEIKWTNKGGIVFELTGYLRRTDVPATSLLVPPQTASYVAAAPPVGAFAPMLSTAELGALRLADVDVPTTGDALVLVNATLQLRVLYLDGVPVAWVSPSGRGELHGLRRGRYVAQWRTFLGDSVETPTTQLVPGLAQVGAMDH
jgi:hypothetical protein